MIKTLNYTVTGQRIEVSESDILVSGTVNVYTARFSFDSEWDDLQRTAVFVGYSSERRIEREQLLTDDTCKIPWETLIPCGYLRAGVYGTNADGSRLPTIWTEKRLYIHAGVGPTEESTEPSPTLVEQLTSRMGDLAALETEDKSSLVAAINEVSKACGETVNVDATLTEAGQAADAKVVGDSLEKLSTEMLTDSELSDAVNNALMLAKESGEFDGEDGAPGRDGVDGQDGRDGRDGVDGATPTVGANGNWYIGEEDTGISAEGQAATIEIVGTETLEAGQLAAVEEADGSTPQARKYIFKVPQGKNGDPGATPQRGTDYWTAADQQAIVDQVLAALPDGDEVSY